MRPLLSMFKVYRMLHELLFHSLQSFKAFRVKASHSPFKFSDLKPIRYINNTQPKVYPYFLKKLMKAAKTVQRHHWTHLQMLHYHQ